MTTHTSTPPATDRDGVAPPDSLLRKLIGRITRFEIGLAAVVAAVLLVLIVIEPEILEAPIENERTLVFTVGGTAAAAVAFVAMLWLRVPAVVRVILLGVPFVWVNWWLLSPYFIDDVVDEAFSTSISEQLATVDDASAAADPAPLAVEDEAPDAPPAPAEPIPEEDEATTSSEPANEEPVSEEEPAPAPPTEEAPPPPPAPAEPVLLGAGQFVGLAGHSGTGDAGIFQNPDGSLVLRFENFDIQNGPDLEVYFVPGADQTSLPEGSIHLGALKGNIGDQNYELPPDTELAPGAYTALVWCEAFSVEFVGATIVV